MYALSRSQTENKPAFDPLDLRQAIQRLTESVRASINHANQQVQTNMTESLPFDARIPNNATVTQTSSQEKNSPPQFYAKEQTETQGDAPWTARAIYAANEEAPPQVYSIYSHLAAMGTPSLRLNTGSSSYQPPSCMMNLSNNRATPLTADTSSTVRGNTNSSAKDYGYGNRDIYSEENLSLDDIRKAVENIVVSIAEEDVDDLVGLADTILDVVLTVWRFGKTTNLVLGTASLVIGVCYVATQTQKKWDTEKAQVLAKYDSKDETGRKKAMAERVAEIFMREAMAYFVGEWAGRIVEAAKESSKWGLVVKLGVGTFLDYMKEETPHVTNQDITEWQEHIMHRLLF